jgi:Flp pilus assembly protein TadG
MGRCVLAVGAIVSIAALGEAAAGASAAAHGGSVHVYLEDTLAQSAANEAGQVVVTGAFGDAGSFTVSGNGIAKVVLSKGTFKVSDAAGEAKEGALFAHLAKYMNPSTCAVAFPYTVAVPIIAGSGTGAYTGISGRLTITTDDVGVWPAKAGKCENSPSSTPTGFVALSQGQGNVSFG